MRFSIGNKKLGADTAIINITPATLCPSRALGLCKLPASGLGSCYAMKAERMYPSVLPFRIAQMREWIEQSAEEIAEGIVTKSQGRGRITPLRYVRLNESGDFKNQLDVDKASRIAELLESKGIAVYGYTARKDLDFTAVHKNLTLNGTGFPIHNEFKPVKVTTPQAHVCPGNCRNCNSCKTRGGRTIEVIYH